MHLHGKGRKERVIPLWKNTATELRAWRKRIDDAPDAPVFPNRHGTAMSRSGVRDRLDRAVAIAQRDCTSLRGRNITPHTLRHSTAIAPAPVRNRSGDDRPVARTLKPRRHPPIPRGRPRGQGSRATTRRRPQSRTSTSPARRPTPRLPPRPVIMCSAFRWIAAHSEDLPPDCT